MPSNSHDIEARLRATCETGAPPDLIYEAADEIRALQAENAALREKAEALDALEAWGAPEGNNSVDSPWPGVVGCWTCEPKGWGVADVG